jgi:HK97 family phage prohead protease
MTHPRRERRTLGASPLGAPGHYEFRAPVELQTDGKTIFGYAAVFNSLSQDLGGFREKIAPGAFKRTLGDGLEKFCLWSHIDHCILGSQGNGTLRLSEDSKGLYFEADTPDGVSYANDVRNLLKQKYISKCSFGFRCYENGSTWFEDVDGSVTRTLVAVQLFEVSVLGSPAYLETEADIRTARDELATYKRSKRSPLETRLKLIELSA